MILLTFWAFLSKIAANNILFFFFFYFLEKIRTDISCESSAQQMIHMKCQVLFSLKNKNEIKMSFAAVVIRALRLKTWSYSMAV